MSLVIALSLLLMMLTMATIFTLQAASEKEQGLKIKENLLDIKLQLVEDLRTRLREAVAATRKLNQEYIEDRKRRMAELAIRRETIERLTFALKSQPTPIPDTELHPEFGLEGDMSLLTPDLSHSEPGCLSKDTESVWPLIQAET